MAYVSKRTGEEVDALLDKVAQGGGGGGSITIDTELSETSNNAIANSAVTKAIGDTATKAELEVVQKETQENSKILAGLTGSAVDFSPTIAYENSEVINGQVSAYQGYQVTAPIFLNKGDTIALTSYSGGGTQAISLTDENGSFYTSIEATPGYKTRTYTAIEDCYVALCWLNYATYPRTITIESASNLLSIIDRLKALEERTTPSGDPMHHAYESLGGLYNASGSDIAFIGVYGETITHKSNHWRLNDLGDLTNEEMQEIFNMRYPSVSGAYLPMWFGGNANVRTNICSTHWNSSYEMNDIFVNNGSIESISLADSMGNTALPRNLAYAFFAASSCHTIINEINLNYATLQTSTFGYCYSLKNIRLLNLHSDIVLSDSPLLSKESLLYMIRNSVQGAEFTITLHPDVYQKAKEGEWEEEVTSAINDYGENITLAEE